MGRRSVQPEQASGGGTAVCSRRYRHMAGALLGHPFGRLLGAFQSPPRGLAEAHVLGPGPRATHLSTAPNTSPFMAARCFGWPEQTQGDFDCASNKPPADQ
jgi:hypothetical protein